MEALLQKVDEDPIWNQVLNAKRQIADPYRIPGAAMASGAFFCATSTRNRPLFK